VRGDTLAFLESLDRPYLHKPFSLAELRSLLADIAREGGAPLRRRDGAAIEAAPGT
jgi:DNA-binding response OmpR family regulator